MYQLLLFNIEIVLKNIHVSILIYTWTRAFHGKIIEKNIKYPKAKNCV